MNEDGCIVEDEWLQTGNVRSNVEIDTNIVMPNHFRGILIINENKYHPYVAIEFVEAIIGQFKSVVTKQINRLRDKPGCPVWQRNYYEHIIRNEKELNSMREYIINNPLQWDLDENNPKNIKSM